MKRLFCVIPLVCLLCFAFGCQDKAAMAELEEFRAQAEVEEKNKALIRKFFIEWNNRNLDILSELFVPDALVHNPSACAASIPFEKAMDRFETVWQAFPDIIVTVDDLIVEKNKVVAWLGGRGTQHIPARGRWSEACAIEIFRIEDGKIVETWEISDSFGLMRQLGLEPMPRGAEK